MSEEEWDKVCFVSRCSLLLYSDIMFCGGVNMNADVQTVLVGQRQSPKSPSFRGTRDIRKKPRGWAYDYYWVCCCEYLSLLYSDVAVDKNPTGHITRWLQHALRSDQSGATPTGQVSSGHGRAQDQGQHGAAGVVVDGVGMLGTSCFQLTFFYSITQGMKC
jgi:hypothetical protein